MLYVVNARVEVVACCTDERRGRRPVALENDWQRKAERCWINDAHQFCTNTRMLRAEVKADRYNVHSGQSYS